MTSEDSVTGNTFSERWNEMYERLVKYKQKHGDCLVPNRYKADPKLGAWVSAQRRHYKILTSGDKKSTPMTLERAKKLIDLGFQWSTVDPRHVSWEDRYEQLKEFQKTYGHVQVPMGWDQNPSLSNWVSAQRQDYKLFQKGRPSRLTQEKINLLDGIGFVWTAQRGGRRKKLVPLKPEGRTNSPRTSSPTSLGSGVVHVTSSSGRSSPQRTHSAQPTQPPNNTARTSSRATLSGLAAASALLQRPFSPEERFNAAITTNVDGNLLGASRYQLLGGAGRGALSSSGLLDALTGNPMLHRQQGAGQFSGLGLLGLSGSAGNRISSSRAGLGGLNATSTGLDSATATFLSTQSNATTQGMLLRVQQQQNQIRERAALAAIAARGGSAFDQLRGVQHSTDAFQNSLAMARYNNQLMDALRQSGLSSDQAHHLFDQSFLGGETKEAEVAVRLPASPVLSSTSSTSSPRGRKREALSGLSTEAKRSRTS